MSHPRGARDPRRTSPLLTAPSPRSPLAPTHATVQPSHPPATTPAPTAAIHHSIPATNHTHPTLRPSHPPAAIAALAPATRRLDHPISPATIPSFTHTHRTHTHPTLHPSHHPGATP